MLQDPLNRCFPQLSAGLGVDSGLLPDFCSAAFPWLPSLAVSPFLIF